MKTKLGKFVTVLQQTSTVTCIIDSNAKGKKWCNLAY